MTRMPLLALVATLLAVVAAPATTGLPVLDEETVTVTLVIDSTAYPVEALREVKECTVTVPADGVVADVLDRATLDACILGWTFTYYPSTLQYGRFVTGIDGRQANCDHLQGAGVCTYWTYRVDGSTAPLGVDLMPVEDGTVYTWTYHTRTSPVQ